MDHLPEKISDYLSSTRFMLPKAGEGDASNDELIYKPIREYVNLLSDGLDLKVDIHVVYSDALKSEAIAIDGQMCIIHDRYLGQALNMMNRLFIYGASKHTKTIYAHKLVSQIFSRYAFYEESVFAAQQYQNGRNEMDHQERQREDGSLIHGPYTHIQELYVILHEHAHHLFRTNRELLDDINGDVKEWIIDYGQKERDIDVLRKAMSTDDISDDEKKYYEENLNKFIEHGEIAAKFCQEIANRSDLVEEFCCDRLAILHMLPYLSRMKNFSNRDKIQAIILCFLHLRTIQLLEARCSFEEARDFHKRHNKFDLQENLYTIFYNARLHHIKEFCYDLLITSEDEHKEIHSHVSTMMYEHSDEILSPSENVMTHLLYDKELREMMSEEFDYIKKNMSESQHIQRVVSAILHYAPVQHD